MVDCVFGIVEIIYYISLLLYISRFGCFRSIDRILVYKYKRFIDKDNKNILVLCVFIFIIFKVWI